MTGRPSDLSALQDVVVGMGHNTRCGRERILTERESAIRARFVRDSFHDGVRADPPTVGGSTHAASATTPLIETAAMRFAALVATANVDTADTPLTIEQQRGNVIDYTSTVDILLLRRYGQHFGSFPKPANRRLNK